MAAWSHAGTMPFWLSTERSSPSGCRRIDRSTVGGQ
jgi:hypothetical protein